jgi:acetyl-CoA carboxylase beta subunit
MNDWELECPVCSHILYGKEVDEDIICDECGSTIHISAACEWIVKSTEYNDETEEWE